MTSKNHSNGRLVNLDAFPNEALGPFRLGDSLWTITEVLEAQRETFRVVDVSWDRENPASTTILLKVDGWITLVFPRTSPPCPQILQRIDIDITIPVSPTTFSSSSSSSTNPRVSTSGATINLGHRPGLKYGSQTLHSSTQPLSRKTVSTLFGPTIQGAERDGRMCYPGIGFEWSACPHRNEKNEAAREEQEMARISIFQDQDGDHQANLRAMSRKVDGEAEWEFRMNERMEGGLRSGRITPGKSVALHFYTRQDPTRTTPYLVTLYQTSAQDILLDLGSPSRRYTREDDRFEGMYERSSERNGQRGRRGQRTWWNYFELGLDFLIDEDRGGVVSKVMVHSNIPGTALFQRYARCPWEIVVPGPNGKTIVCRDDLSSATKALSGSLSNPTGTRGERPAMTLDRTNEPGFEGIVNVEPSRIVALDGIVLEEGPGGKGIASVLIW